MSLENDSQFPMALPCGARLEHYEIKRTLGVGNFGVTYLAHSHRYNLPCVIKELLPGDFATRSSPTQEIVPLSSSLREGFRHCQKDFLREATILHKVKHPNVVEILDLFNANNTSYYVMPYASGMTLENFLVQRGGSLLPESQLLELLYPLLDGLDTVHKHGYLHRDIKPENIIMLAETGQPMLIDFGAARQLIASRSRPMSAILTRCYAPFEQYSNTHNQGPYTDIYALGAVLHRAIVGAPPPEAIDRLGDGGDKYEPLAGKKELGAYSAKLRRAIDTALIPMARRRPQNIESWRPHLPAAPPSSRPRTEKRCPSVPPPLPPPVPPPLPPPPPSPPQSMMPSSPFGDPQNTQHVPLSPIEAPEHTLNTNWDGTPRASTAKLVFIAVSSLLAIWGVLYLILSFMAH
ncbi:serine/threonine protein kinase [Prosthecobacter sp.]|uniref:serine/threonine protein kinase n=1 Tax=Prosthecobacter sp. TaxID=1965333 RepID=UPI00378467F2